LLRKLLTVSLLGLAALGLTISPARAATVTIEMHDDNTFKPPDIQASAGDTIVFKNMGSVPHTATDKGLFDSGNIAGGAQFEVQTDAASFPPTIDYDCTYHVALGMKGTITLAGATGQPPKEASPVPPPVSPSPSPLPANLAAKWWALTGKMPIGLRVFAPLALGMFLLLIALTGLGYLRALKKAKQT
jgi:plastocyanin